MVKTLIVICFGLVLANCAGTTVTPVPTDEADQTASGIRYYQPAPFLLVYTDGKGGLYSQIIFLPDLSRKMSIEPYAYFSQNKTSLTFSNGILSESKNTIDETILPKSILSALESAAVAAAKISYFNFPGAERLTVPAPCLFYISIEKDGVTLIPVAGPDGKKLEPIHVTISTPPATPAPSTPPEQKK